MWTQSTNCLTYSTGANRSLTAALLPSAGGLYHARLAPDNLVLISVAIRRNKCAFSLNEN
jgi:hypothetical protein